MSRKGTSRSIIHPALDRKYRRRHSATLIKSRWNSLHKGGGGQVFSKLSNYYACRKEVSLKKKLNPARCNTVAPVNPGLVGRQACASFLVQIAFER